MAQSEKKLSLRDVIVKVTNMVSYDSNASILAKKSGLVINYVSWEDCARNKGSSWGPCISDMTLRVADSCMPVIRKPNYSDVTWDVKMSNIPIVIGNENPDPQTRLQTISLTDYLSNFSDFMSNTYYKNTLKKEIDLTSQRENKDSHVIMSSQACFLPIQSGQETKFNIALFNYQSQVKNPSVLVIVSTSKGSAAQIIEGKEQHLLFNKNGKKADFIGERVSDYRQKKGQKDNLQDKKLSKQEKKDNVIVVVQVPLKQKVKIQPVPFMNYSDMLEEDEDEGGYQARGAVMKKCAQMEQKVDVEAAMVKISERTKPACKCGKELQKYQVQYAYKGKGVRCDECSVLVNGKEDIVYHCPDGNNFIHKQGYDLCVKCGEKQLEFDELRGILDDDKSYILERDERYPIRVTLQYYEATSNGEMNEEIMEDIVRGLAVSQKQADFMGSLVTEYHKNRPSEWVNEDDHGAKGDDEYREIRNALEEHCGNDWKIYLKKFEDEEVKDADLENITSDDLKELIPKIGPRNRFRKWMESKK